MRQGHADKTIETRLWSAAERRALFGAVRATLTANGKVLVVYPRRQGREDGARSVEDAYALWQQRFPGRAEMVHGRRTDAENQRALSAMRGHDADILIASTIVEVGVDLPDLRRAVVVEPQYFGLTTLHQIRGRVARRSGVGHFDLLVQTALKDAARARLDVLLETDDGFEVAHRDLLLRGHGDLGVDSTRQSGRDVEPLVGHATFAEIEAMLQRIAGADVGGGRDR